MASNLSKRLDRLEKGIQAFLEEKKENQPLFVSEGEPVPEGATLIVMHWVEAQHGQSLDAATSQDGASMLEAGTSQAAKLGDNIAPRKTPSTLPPLETRAERDKRWASHLKAIDMRGERFDPDGPRDARQRDMRRGIV